MDADEQPEHAGQLFDCDCSIRAPQLWASGARGRLTSGLSVVGDYPSLLVPPHFSPWTLLLDTCVVQHLDWARHSAPGLADDLSWRRISARYGPKTAQDLQALAGLLGPVEDGAAEQPSRWVVGRSSWEELGRAPVNRRDRLLGEWRRWRESATTFGDDGEIEPWSLFCSPPEANGWPSPDQEPLPGLESFNSPATRLGPFSHPGDVALIQEALLLEVPGILTTDRKSFWRHRRWLFAQGVEVWRPAHLSWAFLDEALVYGRSAIIVPGWPKAPFGEDFPAVAAA